MLQPHSSGWWKTFALTLCGLSGWSPCASDLSRHKKAFLGHTINSKGIATDLSKATTVRDWPAPVNVHQLQSFLGLASYYQRIVKNFATLATPLHKLMQKGQAFCWDCEQAFVQLRSALRLLCIIPIDSGHLSWTLMWVMRGHHYRLYLYRQSFWLCTNYALLT